MRNILNLFCGAFAVTLIVRLLELLFTLIQCVYGGFGFYDHLDIMNKMVWSQIDHIQRRLLYSLKVTKIAVFFF